MPSWLRRAARHGQPACSPRTTRRAAEVVAGGGPGDGRADRARLERDGLRVAVLDHGDDLVAYARQLYADLRAADAAGADRIVAVLPAARGLGHAIRDRLTRAANRDPLTDPPGVLAPTVGTPAARRLGWSGGAAEGVEVGDPGVADGVEVGDGAAVEAGQGDGDGAGPASGTRSRRHQQPNGSPRATSSWYGGSSAITSPSHVPDDQQRLERLGRQRLDRERGDVVGDAATRAWHVRRPWLGSVTGRRGVLGSSVAESGDGVVERRVEAAHRPRSCRRRGRVELLGQPAPGAPAAPPRWRPVPTPRTAYGSSATGAVSEPRRRPAPTGRRGRVRVSGLRRSGPWRPAGTPSVMHADSATSSGISSRSRSSASTAWCHIVSAPP